MASGHSTTTASSSHRPTVAPLRLIVLLSAIAIASQFHRNSLAVIAPELIRELSISPQMLGLAGGAFFIAMAAVQVPLGVLLDWVGPRRLVTGLTVLAVAGVLLAATARSAEALVGARLLIGLGCSASMMAVVLMCSRWFSGDRLASALSWVFALSQAGALLAASPLAAAAQAIGWRAAFVAAAIVTALIGAAFWFLVTSDHPTPDPPSRPAETLRDALRGLAEVLRTPGLFNLVAIQAVSYASVGTLLGLWAGPYLHDVHGMDAASRGYVLSAMATLQVLGMLACGPLDARLNSRKRIVLTGGGVAVAILATLALVPRPPTVLAVALLVSLSAIATYGVTLAAHGRGLFSDRLIGRGITTVNMAQLTGTALMPMVTGAIAAALSAESRAAGATGYPEVAYRAMFALLGGALALGLLAFSRGPDSRAR